MAVNKTLVKSFTNLSGIDLSNTEITQDPTSCLSMINADFRDTGDITKCKGYQFAASTEMGSYGGTLYENADDEGIITEELLTIDDNLYRMEEDSFTLTYSPGTGWNGSYEIYYDSDDSTFYFDLYDEDLTQTLHYALGNGYSGTNRTVANLVTAINAVSGYTATSPTTAGGTNATFIPLTADPQALADGVAATITFKYLTQVALPSTYSDPFSTFYSKRTTANFENATFAQLNNVMYIATGHEVLHKYDGLRVYKAGLPKPTALTAGSEGTGSLDYTAPGTAYKWKYTYLYKDAKGNEIESEPSDELSFTTTGASKSYSMTLTNLQETSGFNVSQAVVNGAQNGVTTITVDSGHGLVTGDWVYLYDGVTSAVVSVQITATTATTITIDSANVNVADNAVISCILLVLYRTEADGTLFYMSKELPNDTDNNTVSYDDGIADASLDYEFEEQIKPHGVPPILKYIRAWRGQLVGAYNNVAYYSDIESPEYFPPADNSFNLPSTITGMREADNIFYVFQDKAIHMVSGDFGIDQFEVDILNSEGVGCSAHATIQSLANLVWFLSKDGIYALSGSNISEVSRPIKKRIVRPDYTLTFKQAVAAIDGDKYIILLPNLPVDASYCHDTQSNVWVFNANEKHKAWYEWNNVNFFGGYVILNGESFMLRRSKPASTLYTHPARVLATNTRNDYCFHDEAIEFTYKTAWESLQEPSVFKKFLKVKIHSLDSINNEFETPGFELVTTIFGNYINDSMGEYTINFSEGVGGWGSSWGNVPWGESIAPGAKTRLIPTKLKSLQLSFSNSNFKENVLISGYELEVVTPYKTDIKE